MAVGNVVFEGGCKDELVVFDNKKCGVKLENAMEHIQFRSFNKSYQQTENKVYDFKQAFRFTAMRKRRPPPKQTNTLLQLFQNQYK